MSTGGGCEAVVTARARCRWAKFKECGELLYERRLTIKLKLAVYKRYVRPAIIYGSKVWCLRKQDGNLAKDREIHGEEYSTKTEQEVKI